MSEKINSSVMFTSNGTSPSYTTTATSTLPVLTRAVSANSVIPHTWKEPKTSTSHPLNISWIVPSEVLRFLSVSNFPDNIDLYDLLNPEIRDQVLRLEKQQLQELESGRAVKGNLCLSSCPGKKVRLSGPVKGRASINRDLDLDFERLASFGITMVVCCLNDKDLEYLGAPWAKYEMAAKAHKISIIRLPMIEGNCPKTLSEVRRAVIEVNKEINKGHNVLAHCRGGVGRAGLFAGCWLLENFLCRTVERAVYVLRERRSSKAIETYTQAEFLIRYAMSINQKYNLTFKGATITDLETQVPNDFENGLPSIPFIAKLENQILVDPALANDEYDTFRKN